MDMNRALVELEQRTLTEMRRMERTILGRMELLHTQLNSKLYFIESKLDVLTDGMQQQQQQQSQQQLRPHNKRDPHHHRYHHNPMHNGGRLGRRTYGREFRPGGPPPQFHYYAENEENGVEMNSSPGAGNSSPPELAQQQQQQLLENNNNGGGSGGGVISNTMCIRPYNGVNGGNNGNGGAFPFNNPNNANGNFNGNFNGGGHRNGSGANFRGPPPQHPQQRISRKHSSCSLTNYPGGIAPHHGSTMSLYGEGNGGCPPQMVPLSTPHHRAPASNRAKQRKQQMMNTYFDGFGSALNKMAAANKWTINGVRVSPDDPPLSAPPTVENSGGSAPQHYPYGAMPSEPLKQTHGTATNQGKQLQWTARSLMGSYTDDEEDNEEDDDEDADDYDKESEAEEEDEEYKDALQNCNNASPVAPAGNAKSAQPHAQSSQSAQSQLPFAQHNKVPAPAPKCTPPPAEQQANSKIGQPPAMVGGFAQALSRMAAANKWSIRPPKSPKSNTNGGGGGGFSSGNTFVNNSDSPWGIDTPWEEANEPSVDQQKPKTDQKQLQSDQVAVIENAMEQKKPEKKPADPMDHPESPEATKPEKAKATVTGPITVTGSSPGGGFRPRSV